MPRIKFGIFPCTEDYPDGKEMVRVYEEIVAEAKLAEEVGFDSCMITEHHQQPDGYFPNPLMVATGIARETTTLKVGTCVALAPLYHPVRLAEDTALLDVISNGRLQLGLGAGYVDADLDAFGVDMSQRGVLFDDTVRFIKQAWTESNLTFKGEHYTFENVNVTPKPVQKPRPEIWCAAWTPQGLRRAGRIGDRWITDVINTLPTFNMFADIYKKSAQDNGQTPAITVLRECWVAPTYEQAVAEYGEYVMTSHRFYYEVGGYNEQVDPWLKDLKSADEFTLDKVATDRFIMGSPEDCIEQIEKWNRDLGTDYFVMRFRHPNGPEHKKAMEAIKLFGEKVIPHFAYSAAPVTEPLWVPSEERKEQAQLTRYARWLGEQRGLHFAVGDYESLWRWSVDHPDDFWASVWEYFEVVADPGYSAVLGRREMPGAEWFPGARLNYAEHIFRGKDDGDLAVQYASERQAPASWTFGELRARTAALAAGLRAAGVGVGDRVAAYLPNIPEAMAAGLACMSLGAVWSACSPDFGVRSVVDRFAQIEPTVLLAVDGYRYGGKDFPRLGEVRALQKALPSVRRTVVLRYLDPDADLSGLRDAVLWEDFEEPGEDLVFERVPSDHPLWVVYSSGTTGLPKPIVHSHGGMLVDQLKYGHLHFDAKAGDRLFWFTTTGWVMWNVMLGMLLSEASIIIYDGNPGHPDLGVLWDLAEQTGMTLFGTSASYIVSCMKAGVRPRSAGRSLAALRSVGSTGSALSADGFEWVYRELGPDIWLNSSSGGTDVAGPFICGVPWLPVYPAELQARCLGVAVDSWDPSGRPLVGETGELVITKPMPAMPISFWGDDDGSRYREAYFDMYPGVWRHGDWLELTPRGSGILYGRSDATINRGGVRMGSAELYRAVLTLDEVVDALVVDLPGGEGVDVMPMFVVLAEGASLDDGLVDRIRRTIREQVSPRHVPDRVFAVPELPRTLTGKTLEIPVKRLLLGAEIDTVASRDSLANPQALEWFEQSRKTILDQMRPA